MTLLQPGPITKRNYASYLVGVAVFISGVVLGLLFASPGGHLQQQESDMGSWTIKIKGVGSHHNGTSDDGTPSVPEDAEKMSQTFVADLQSKGHSIESATFTQTGNDPVDNLLEQ